MLFALVHLIHRRLLGLLVAIVRADVAKDVELLVVRHENAVLCRKVPRPRYAPTDRFWFTALSRLVLRRSGAMILPGDFGDHPALEPPSCRPQMGL